jgi:hypothetical protein
MQRSTKRIGAGRRRAECSRVNARRDVNAALFTSERDGRGRRFTQRSNQDTFEPPRSVVAESSEFDRNGLTTGFSRRAPRSDGAPDPHQASNGAARGRLRRSQIPSIRCFPQIPLSGPPVNGRPPCSSPSSVNTSVRRGPRHDEHSCDQRWRHIHPAQASLGLGARRP